MISAKCIVFALAITVFFSTVWIGSIISADDLPTINGKNHPIVRVDITNEDIYRSYQERVGNLRTRIIHNSSKSVVTRMPTQTDEIITAQMENNVDSRIQRKKHNESTSKTTYKIAIVEIYVGQSLPPWFRTFALSVEMSDPLLKWIIFVTEAFEIDTTFRNIKIIRLTRLELYTRLSRLDSFQDDVKYFGNLIEHAPYALVEFKPCLGIIFSVRSTTIYSHLILVVLISNIICLSVLGVSGRVFSLGIR